MVHNLPEARSASDGTQNPSVATPCGFDPRHRHHGKSSFRAAFFSEINPFGICEMHFVREIRFQRVKCLQALKDLFHFSSVFFQ